MGLIVSIHSFRGGTGKSNLTANLAVQAALAGKRVAVVDTDIQSPGIHVLFGITQHTMGKTLNDFLNERCPIDDVAQPVKNLMSGSYPTLSENLQLWLIPSSINAREIGQVLRKGYDVARLNEGLQTLLQELALDYLFIDTHPGLNEETLLSIAISDVLLVVLRPDQQDVQGTAVTVDIARSLDVPHLFLIVNKVLPRYDFGEVKRRMEDLFQAPVAEVLPLSEDVADNGSATVFSLRFPEHSWSQKVRALSAKLLSLEAGA